MSTFPMVHNYRFTTDLATLQSLAILQTDLFGDANDRFTYIIRTIRFSNIQCFVKMSKTIYNISILIMYITIIHRITDQITCLVK